MKITIYHNLPSGGGKRALLEIVRRLYERFTVDVYTLSTAEHDFCDLRPYTHRHIVIPFELSPALRRPLGRLNQGIRLADLFRLRALQRRIAQQINVGGYDLAFVHHCQYGQSPALLQLLEIPSIYYCHEPPRFMYEPNPLRPYDQLAWFQRAGNLFDPFPSLYRKVFARMDRKNVLSADLILANSCYSRESLYRTYGIFARVSYLGVDTDYFRVLSAHQKPFVLSVGHLNPRKGFDFLIESLALIDATERPKLVIVSDFQNAQERYYLDALAGKLGVVVEFRTRIADEELVQLYNQARLTLYAPVMEPFGFVPLESMACGTPVVGVREGGVRESVRHGETGLLVERDTRSFAEAISVLYNDDERIRQFGAAGRAYVEQEWSWDRSVRDVEKSLLETGKC